MHKVAVMKKIILTIILITNIYLIHASSYTIKYDNTTKSILYYTVQSVYTDSDGQIFLQKTFPVPIKINGIRLYKNGRYLPIRYKIRKNYIIINNTGLKNEKIDLFMDFSIEMKVFRYFILPGINIYVPLFVFEPYGQTLEDINHCYVELPQEWSMLSPNYMSYMEGIDDEYSIYQFTYKWKDYPVILTGKKLTKYPLTDDKQQESFTFHGKKRLQFLFNNRVKNSKSIETLNTYLQYIEEYFGIPLDDHNINFLLYAGLLNITVAIDDALLISGAHFLSLNKETENNYNYDIIYELAYSILRDRIDFADYERESWLIDGMAHMVAIDYFDKKYSLNLNRSNNSKFMQFLLGKKNSNYARSASAFRDYTRFRQIKSLLRDNTPKLIGYNYRSRALKNRYTIQAFYLLKKINETVELRNFIQHILANYGTGELNTANFIREIENFYDIDTALVFSRFIALYPKIDYKLKIEKDTTYLVRTKGASDLPVEISIKHKDNTIERKMIFMDTDRIDLNINPRTVKRISIDPDGLIDEDNKINNYYRLPVNFSFLAPFYTQDSYTFTANAAIVNYNSTNHYGLSTTGGWNAKGFTPNTLIRPALLWGVDVGYGYDSDETFKNIHNAFINVFFETSLNPMTVWAPHFYSHLFFHTGESLSVKLGIRNFLPPVINTEHDRLYFNHSIDAGWDLKFKHHPFLTMDMNVNGGYKLYFKSRFYTLEGILAYNFDFDGMRPKDINLGFHLENKLDFRLIEIDFRTGILKGFFPRRGYEYYRPKITRLSLVTQSIGYYETIGNNLAYASSLIIDNPYPQMDFFFLHHYFIFKLVLLSEPLLEPMATIGIGPYLDFHLPMIFSPDGRWASEYVRSLMAGAMLKIDVMRKTSIILRFTIAPLIWVDNKMNNLYAESPGPIFPLILGFTLFEVRSYL